MLITELKSKETILSLIKGKVFIINCHGCREVRFPEEEAVEFRKELAAAGKLTGFITTDYICNVENLKLRLEKHADEIAAADAVLVLSCGVGVQTVAEQLAARRSSPAATPWRSPASRALRRWSTSATSAASAI